MSTKRIRKVVYDLFSTKLRFKEMEQNYKQKCKELQDEIQLYMNDTEVEKMQLIGKGNEPSFSITNVKPKKIEFDIEKLEERIKDKKILNQIFVKKYEVTDYEGLVKLVRSYGVKPSEFKRFFNVTKTVDVKKIDELSELGEMCYNDIKGCYEIVPGSSYVKITEIKNEKD